jgi:hypothetical protein
MSRAVVSLILLALVAMVGVYGLQAALADAGEDHTITNETWTPDAGNWTTLEESNLTGAYYADDVTVRDENDTVMDDAGADYEWNATDGRVKAVAGGELDGDANASITYEYQQTTEEQRGLAGLVAIMPKIVGVAFVVVGFLLFLSFING